ncbi:MAG: DNA topoisomerase VI subunit B [Planctomycetes bacterium]|nr:DNA topoisomerase VI subunit B [Planctomycetota bacterium]
MEASKSGANAPLLFDLEQDGKAEGMKAKEGRKSAKGESSRDTSESESAPPKKDEGGRRATAQELATKQREISVSEFFTKNRHLLGFDSPLKALLTAVKEAVDNSLDACEEAGILPEITVEITKTGEDRFRMAVEDNGPGIVPEQIGKVFGKLLYGSKFHKLSQTRGQQGIGISAAGMYGQLTTGLPVRIVSRTSKKQPAHEYQLSIDTLRNKPDIHESKTMDEWHQEHGTRVEIEMEARYQRGDKSVDMYLKETAIANPHLTLHYKDPTVGSEGGSQLVTYERATKHLPPEAVEIKPHPHGVELGRLIAMLKETESRTLSSFLQEEFVRVGPKVVDDICSRAKVSEKSRPAQIAREEASALHTAIQSAKIMSPPTNCLSPIGEELILAGLKKEIEADFYCATTRPAAVYRGNPFQIEAGIAYGKPGGVGLELTEEGRIQKRKSVVVTEDLVGDADAQVRILRFANRVPLLYQQGACAVTRAVIETNWKNYGLSQPKGSLPIGPCAVFVHIASVWVPFTSESKEAIANYDEIVDEIELALRECGRKLGQYIRKGKRLQSEFNKRSYIEKYIPHIGIALQEILDLSDPDRDQTVAVLDDVLQKSRKV